MAFPPKMCAPFDVIFALPWFNRRRPFFGIHVALWGHGCGRRPTTIYHVGLIAGRQFMPLPGNGGSRSLWFDVAIPRRVPE